MPLLRLHSLESGITAVTFRFDPMLVDAMKANGMRFDPDGKMTSLQKSWWTDDPKVAEKLRLVAGEADARSIHAELTRARREAIVASFASDSDREFPVPKGLSYLPYQRAGIAFALDRQGTLFGDEPGLGKTVEAVGVLNTITNIIRALVICPASLKTNWLRELRKWLVYKDLTVGVAQGGYLPDTNIIVINYDIVKRHKKDLLDIKWDCIIGDELHMLKNPQAERTKAVFGVRAKKKGEWVEPPLTAPIRLALTGTPILNRPAELFTVLNWLAPDQWPSRGAFGRRYCAGGTSFYDGASNLQELQVRLRSSVMIRRLKSEVLTDLPAKMRQVIEFDDPESAGKIEAERTAAQKYEMGLAMLKAAAELAKASDNPDEYKDAILALRRGVSAAFDELAKLRYDTAMSKVPYVIGHLKGLFEQMPDAKFVVFAHHHDVMDRIYEAFPWQSVKLSGDMSTEARQKSVDRFQTDASVRLFVGSMKAAGVGLTLTASSHVVFAELDWVPATLSQAEDRLHRISQRNTVLVQHLVLAGSLDAVISRRIIDKQAVIDQALDQRVDNADIVIPTVAVESYEGARIEEIDRESVTFSDDRIGRVQAALHALPTPENPVDQIIVSRLKELKVLTARQAALADKVISRNLVDKPPAVV